MRVKTGLLVLAVLAVAVLPAVGDAITTTGSVTYGFTLPLTVSPLAASDTLSATVTFAAQADDWIYGYVQAAYAKRDIMTSPTATAASTIADIGLGAAYLKTDLGKFFKLGDLGLVLQGGYTSAADNSYDSTTAYGSEAVSNAGVGTNWMFFVTANYSTFINLKFAMSPTQTNDWLIGAYTSQTLGFGTVAAEVFYDAAGQANAGDGNLIIDGEVKPTFGDIALDVGAGFRYGLAASSINWGAGVGVKYGTMVNVKGGVFGNNTDALAGVVADLQISPVALIDILAGMKLDTTAAAAQTFTGADIALRFNIGVADLYLGYLITSVGGGNVWAPVATTDGGLYFKITASF